MKILYVSTISDTVNRFLIPHIKMLRDKGHQVDVAFKIKEKPSDKLKEMNCSINELDFDRSIFKNNYSKLIKYLKKIVSEGSYDIVHTHTPIASAIVRFACREFDNVRVFYTAHGFHFYKGAPFKNWLIYYPIERYLSKFTDTIITINQEDYSRALNHFSAKNIEYIPGVGLDLKKFNNVVVNRKKCFIN